MKLEEIGMKNEKEEINWNWLKALYIRERNSLNMTTMRWQKRGKEFGGVEILKFEWNRGKGRERSTAGMRQTPGRKCRGMLQIAEIFTHSFWLSQTILQYISEHWMEWSGQRPGARAVGKQQNNCRFIKKEGDIFRAWSRWKRKEMTTKAAAVEGSR